jgi:hypothetical protein
MNATDREAPQPDPAPGPASASDEAAALEKLLDASLNQLEQQVDSTRHYLASFEPSVPPRPPRAKPAR